MKEQQQLQKQYSSAAANAPKVIAFLSWYAFPPLLTVTIKKDLKLSQTEIANSNIIALTATLLVRLVGKQTPTICTDVQGSVLTIDSWARL